MAPSSRLRGAGRVVGWGCSRLRGLVQTVLSGAAVRRLPRAAVHPALAADPADTLARGRVFRRHRRVAFIMKSTLFYGLFVAKLHISESLACFIALQ